MKNVYEESNRRTQKLGGESGDSRSLDKIEPKIIRNKRRIERSPTADLRTQKGRLVIPSVCSGIIYWGSGFSRGIRQICVRDIESNEGRRQGDLVEGNLQPAFFSQSFFLGSARVSKKNDQTSAFPGGERNDLKPSYSKWV